LEQGKKFRRLGHTVIIRFQRISQTTRIAECPPKKTRHGPCPLYESREAKYEAKKARQRQRSKLICVNHPAVKNDAYGTEKFAILKPVIVAFLDALSPIVNDE
jgi:hypothetical protein